MPPRTKKETDVVTENIAQGKPVPVNKAGDPGAIEKISEFDAGQIELEAFMNEKVMILVHPTEDPNKNLVVVPNVGGVNQPIVRGEKVLIRRKYVEALARARNTRYVQNVPDPTRPDKKQMVPISAVADPFTVLEDKNPNGAAWLDSILKQDG